MDCNMHRSWPRMLLSLLNYASKATALGYGTLKLVSSILIGFASFSSILRAETPIATVSGYGNLIGAYFPLIETTRVHVKIDGISYSGLAFPKNDLGLKTIIVEDEFRAALLNDKSEFEIIEVNSDAKSRILVLMRLSTPGAYYVARAEIEGRKWLIRGVPKEVIVNYALQNFLFCAPDRKEVKCATIGPAIQ